MLALEGLTRAISEHITAPEKRAKNLAVALGEIQVALFALNAEVIVLRYKLAQKP